MPLTFRCGWLKGRKLCRPDVSGKLPYPPTPTDTSGNEGRGGNDNKTFMAATGRPAGTTDHDTGYLSIVYNVFLEKTEEIGQVEDKKKVSGLKSGSQVLWSNESKCKILRLKLISICMEEVW